MRMDVSYVFLNNVHSSIPRFVIDVCWTPRQTTQLAFFKPSRSVKKMAGPSAPPRYSLEVPRSNSSGDHQGPTPLALAQFFP